jgi:hypothetical protein
VLHRDRATVGLLDDQTPQPHPAIGVHRGARSEHRVADDETTMAASDTSNGSCGRDGRVT